MICVSSILKLTLIATLSTFCVACATPSVSTVRREFADQYPRTKVTNVELIFEQDGVADYLVMAESTGISEEGKYDFALKRSWGSWSWCDDQTERKCK